jgi:NosR/NirI family nitrous oxide reductase transcriptional regulator
MNRKYYKIGLFILMVFTFIVVNAQRFPKPEFDSGYEQPTTTTPEPRAAALEFVDVFILFGVLSLATWLIIKKRSRRGVLEKRFHLYLIFTWGLQYFLQQQEPIS